MSGNKGVLVFCEAGGDNLAGVALELLGAGGRLAAALGEEISVVMIGNGIAAAASKAIEYGANAVYLADDPLLKDFALEPYLKVMEKVCAQLKPSIILLGQNAAGRELAPWLAWKLDSSAGMDCLALEIDQSTHRLLMTKPVYGGNAQAVQISRNDPQIATLRLKAAAPAAAQSGHQGKIINIAPEIDPAALKVKVLEHRVETAAGISLEDARVVVCGGRGIGSLAGFQQLAELTGVLKGALGATRPPCDNKWIADTRQIGLTGKVVSPDLYFAIGLSGASQHLAGCSGAKVIVAVNKDPEANIFKVADFGIAADWKTVVPALTARLKEIT